jgi:hypothetical protein
MVAGVRLGTGGCAAVNCIDAEFECWAMRLKDIERLLNKRRRLRCSALSPADAGCGRHYGRA